jgi:hypothetical protein
VIRGELLTIEGSIQSGEMVLNGVYLTTDGKERLIPAVYCVRSKGTRALFELRRVV